MEPVFRRAQESDAWALMQLYQRAAVEKPNDPLLLDFKALSADLASPASVWFVGEGGGKIALCLSLLVDGENRLAKIHRLLLDPDMPQPLEMLRAALPRLIERLSGTVDVLYTTTKTLTLKQQELSLGLGFQVIGIFPNATGADRTKLNGITAYYFDEVLTRKRETRFEMHPVVKPFFEIVRKQCGLKEQPVAEVEAERVGQHAPYELEVVRAPHFVAHRYARLKERSALSVQFYPFQYPNALVTDPSQRIEVFVRLLPEMRFAAIISERLDVAVDPGKLYDRVAGILNENGATYIEVLNDAGETGGVQGFLDAGFLPCAYVPAFKKQGDCRRDYLVMARSFERLFHCLPERQGALNPRYREFFEQYYKLEGQGIVG